MHSSPHPQSFKIDLSEAVGDRKLDQSLSGRKSAWIFLHCRSYMKKIGATLFVESLAKCRMLVKKSGENSGSGVAGS